MIDWHTILWCCITLGFLLICFLLIYYIVSARMMKKKREELKDQLNRMKPGKDICSQAVSGERLSVQRKSTSMLKWQKELKLQFPDLRSTRCWRKETLRKQNNEKHTKPCWNCVLFL
ncbi:hypothetical protein [[Clostridium] innocuum]|uniref:hypothetical protein n=1 Tax=Clostridium innocuum TaxID=1522 RepID=UPI001FD9834F|nr:hypothetical protein [[Clostridium] innocuum]